MFQTVAGKENAKQVNIAETSLVSISPSFIPRRKPIVRSQYFLKFGMI